MNLPNQLTIARLVLALVFVAFMSFSHLVCYVLAYLVFVAATITDYYDGKIARARGLVTNFGKLVDPVADKILLVSAFVMLMKLPGLRIPGWTVVTIVAREFLVTGARSLAASEGKVIPANKWGKIKTVIQMVYVFTFLALVIVMDVLDIYPALGAWIPGGLALCRDIIETASLWGIAFVAAYTVYSGVQFMRVNRGALNLGKEL